MMKPNEIPEFPIPAESVSSITTAIKTDRLGHHFLTSSPDGKDGDASECLLEKNGAVTTRVCYRQSQLEINV